MKALYSAVVVAVLGIASVFGISAIACIRPLTAKAHATFVADAQLHSLGQSNFTHMATYYLGGNTYRCVYQCQGHQVLVEVHGQKTFVLGLPQCNVADSR